MFSSGFMFKNGLALVLRSVLFEPNVDSMLYVSQGGTTLLIYASHNGLPISVSLATVSLSLETCGSHKLKLVPTYDVSAK